MRKPIIIDNLCPKCTNKFKYCFHITRIHVKFLYSRFKPIYDVNGMLKISKLNDKDWGDSQVVRDEFKIQIFLI